MNRARARAATGASGNVILLIRHRWLVPGKQFPLAKEEESIQFAVQFTVRCGAPTAHTYQRFRGRSVSLSLSLSASLCASAYAVSLSLSARTPLGAFVRASGCRAGAGWLAGWLTKARGAQIGNTTSVWLAHKPSPDRADGAPLLRFQPTALLLLLAARVALEDCNSLQLNCIASCSHTNRLLRLFSATSSNDLYCRHCCWRMLVLAART